MLGHLNILLNAVSLAAGVAAVLFIIQTCRRYPSPILKYLLYSVILYNLVSVIDVTSIYSCINLMDDCLAFQSTLFARAIGPLSSLFFIMMTYFLVRMMLAIMEKDIAIHTLRLIRSGFWIIVSSYGARIILSLFKQSYPIFPFFQSSLLTTAYLILPGSLIIFLIQGFSEKDALRKKIILTAGLVYLTCFSGLALFGTLLGDANRILIPVMYLLLNCTAYFGVMYLFLPYYKKKSVRYQGNAILDSLCSKYAISKREREIAELILLGKSNKEIEANLFISMGTVKNHIYSLYQKLGINSRGQLVHLFLEFEKR